MTFRELREKSGMTQQEFSEYFGIPRRNVEDWDVEKSKCRAYWVDLMAYKLENEGIIKNKE